jgi:hypothetical protein
MLTHEAVRDTARDAHDDRTTCPYIDDDPMT